MSQRCPAQAGDRRLPPPCSPWAEPRAFFGATAACPPLSAPRALPLPALPCPSPALPARSPVQQPSAKRQCTNKSFKTPKPFCDNHIREFHSVGFSLSLLFSPLLLSEQQAASGTQANWDTGKIVSILSIMHGKCPSCCGTHQRVQTFQQLLLWSHSCPSVMQAAKVAPSLFHLIWAGNDRQGARAIAAAGGAAAGGGDSEDSC